MDSFYTFLKNKKEGGEKITHLIFVHGFDIDLLNKALFEETSARIRKIAEAEDVEVIFLRTNIREILDEMISWDWGHGGALCGVALMLRAGLKRVYIPSTDYYEQLFPWGSQPALDPLWSTEATKIFHDGNEANRVQKVSRYIANSDNALEHLRVCYKNVAGKYNCGACEKCLRTMIELRVANVLDKSGAFTRPLDLRAVCKIDARSPGVRVHLEASLCELERKNQDEELQQVLRDVLLKSEKISFFRRIRDGVTYFDGAYNKNRLYKVLSKRGII